MSIVKQIDTLKKNWLIIIVMVVGLILLNFNNTGPTIGKLNSEFSLDYAGASRFNSFAPEIQERIITKSANLNTEVKRGNFYQVVSNFKSIIKASDSIIINENFETQELNGILSARFQIKVDSRKYDVVVDGLKELGKVISFNENLEDVTGQHSDLSVELEAENARLQRFKDLLFSSTSTSDKIQVTDRIFEIERRINWVEMQINNIDTKVEYSNVYLNIAEQPSAYKGIEIIKFSTLIKDLVSSFNNLVSWIIYLIPWIVIAGIGLILYLRFRK